MRTAVIADGATSTTIAGRPLDGIVETRPATVRHRFLRAEKPLPGLYTVREAS
jgi:hypothetical protein